MSRNRTSINRSAPCGRPWFEVHGEREVLVRLTLRRKVKRRTRDLQQSALPADRQVRMVAFDHAVRHRLSDQWRSNASSLPAPGLQRSFQKRVGHRQLPDLGMQIPDLILIDHRRLAATAFKDTGRAIEQRAFSLIDHRRMHAEPARQLRHGPLAFQHLKCHLRLEPRGVPLSSRHRRSPS